MSCLVRDVKEGHVDYTKNASIVVNVEDKELFTKGFRKSYVDAINMFDDHYLHHLHKPLWVCRHKLENGKECWALSNICNEMSLLLMQLTHTSTMIAMLAQAVEN